MSHIKSKNVQVTMRNKPEDPEKPTIDTPNFVKSDIYETRSEHTFIPKEHPLPTNDNDNINIEKKTHTTNNAVISRFLSKSEELVPDSHAEVKDSKANFLEKLNEISKDIDEVE